MSGSEAEPSDSELVEELRKAKVADLLVHTCSLLASLAFGKLAPDLRDLDDARLAIDALGCVVEGLAGRLGEQERSLKDGLSQLRLAYVQINAATGPSAQGGNGDEAATHTAE